jgi:hypothetical protein
VRSSARGAGEVPAGRRDAWLRLDDAALLKQCAEERYRASGPGGQRRNKVETAVRLRHRASGAVSQAEEARSLEENRRRAVHRLRLRIALHVRAPFDLGSPQIPAELLAHRRADGALAINTKNAAYPLVVAAVLDALQAAGGSYAVAAPALGITTSQLLRFLRRDREVWRALSEGATAAG